MSPKLDKPEILTEEFWEPPQNRDKGSPVANDVYVAVGFACTFWEFVENDLAELFCAFTSRKGPIRRAYGTIFGNAGRRAAVQAAAEAYFGEYWANNPVRSATTNLLHAIGLASKRRDEIVHGTVSSYTTVAKDGRETEHGAFLTPPEYNTRYASAKAVINDLGWRSSGFYRYTGEDITLIGEKFLRLAEFIRWHRGRVQRKEDGTIPLIEELIAGGRIARK